MSVPANSICLALETAVGAGSVAVLRDGVVIADSDRGDTRPARAEHLLTVIDEVLKKAALTLHEVSLLAVSIGPGSYSGIRIGVSTAIGLKDALGIECRGVSSLEAIAAFALPERDIVAAVPVGKNDIAWQRFDCSSGVPKEVSTPALVSLADFTHAIEGKQSSICAPRNVIERIEYAGRNGATVVDDETTLAVLIGKSAIERPANSGLKPIYLRTGTGF